MKTYRSKKPKKEPVLFKSWVKGIKKPDGGTGNVIRGRHPAHGRHAKKEKHKKWGKSHFSIWRNCRQK